jgi:hypothetical protein
MSKWMFLNKRNTPIAVVVVAWLQRRRCDSQSVNLLDQMTAPNERASERASARDEERAKEREEIK